MVSPVEFKYLGLIPYQQALDLMLDLRSKRQQNLIPDTVLFLEHPAVITMGKRKAFEDLKCSPEELKSRGIDFKETDRGGKLTYHGPGQLVTYFVVDIQALGFSIQEMVRRIEEGMIAYLHGLNVFAARDERNPGLWVGDSKIAAIGLHVQKGVTTHGAALNLRPDLGAFDLMIPCGLQGITATSVHHIKGEAPSVEEASRSLTTLFEKYLSDGA